MFETDLYTKAISRDAVAGTKIVRVVAEDPDLVNDSSPNSNSVRYRIDETVYRYGDRVRQASGFLTIDEKSGVIRLAQSPHASAGGVFESRIASSDHTDVDSHIANTKLKVRRNLKLLQLLLLSPLLLPKLLLPPRNYHCYYLSPLVTITVIVITIFIITVITTIIITLIHTTAAQSHILTFNFYNSVSGMQF
ncbi:unnamed protein product [Gongylonema pulchrum]|uniref:Cadherin domain-containing protein n=1 Tax=Gongylonema pulchrum TaxID=637853 RepID=A0A183F0R2_9BILA|nr:unnamed protein product [Gongylonema pulchrum]